MGADVTDNRFKDYPIDARFPTPGVDVRFKDWPTDNRFRDGLDTRFEGSVYGAAPDDSAVNGRQPVLLLDFERGVYGDNPVWWLEAGSSPYEVSGALPISLIDFETDRYAGNEVWWAEAPTQPADAVVFADFENGRYAA